MRHGINLAGGLCLLFSVTTSAAEPPTVEELWQQVQRQQQQIEALQEALQGSESRLQDATTQLEAAAGVLESSDFSSASPGVSIGGYGEIHYNSLDSGDELDFHRFVLFFGHAFSDTVSFYSELEVEHTVVEGGEGAVELEQAFIQWDFAPNHLARMGVFLVPVGILNETHEPDTFYGVERNSVENKILPATWWEGGVAFAGELAPGWGYDVAVHSGLNLDTANPDSAARGSIRGARQQVAEANADSLAYTARLRYSGVAGLQWHTTVQYQSDLTQGDADNIGIGKIDGTLFETDARLMRGMFGLRALYARWDLNDRIELLSPGAGEQVGWYVEPSVRFTNGLGLFARYGSYDLTASTAATSDEHKQLDLGVNYWLHENVVIKADIQRQDNDNGSDNNGFNIGVGYSF